MERVRELPWLGVGEQGNWTNVYDALEAGSMVDMVCRENIYTIDHAEVPGIKVNTCNGEILGVVQDNYSIVQNLEAFSMMQPFLDEGGVITNVGITQQGLYFMVLRMQQLDILNEPYDMYVVCMNSFNGRYPLNLIATPIRVYCNNMFRKIMDDRLLSIRHSRHAGDRLETAKLLTGGLVHYTNNLVGLLNTLAVKRISNQTLDKFAELLLPDPVQTNDEQTKRFDTMLEKQKERRAMFINQYYRADDNQHEGTALGLLNAYTDWTSHRDATMNRQGVSWNDRRLTGLLSGDDIDSKLVDIIVK